MQIRVPRFSFSFLCGYIHHGSHSSLSASASASFNYWKRDEDAAHAVSNQTHASPDDDASHNAAAFVDWLATLGGNPFLAQISFHNCHVPFIGTAARKAACNSSSECNAIVPGAAAYSEEELDMYACLNEFDNSVGTTIDALKAMKTKEGEPYYQNTLVWFSGGDNGPEVNCPPEGRCGSGSTGKIPAGTLHRPSCRGAASAGPLRGRKRDVWEGGHR